MLSVKFKTTKELATTHIQNEDKNGISKQALEIMYERRKYGETNYCLSERRIDSTFKQKYPSEQAHSRSDTQYRNIG
jgi:hypothetical protein